MNVKAVLFDVQGTLTDFSTTLQNHGTRVLGGRISPHDWAEIVTAWRLDYRQRVALAHSSGKWESVTAIYRDGLRDQLEKSGHLSIVADADIDRLTAAWNELEPWPEVKAGLANIRRHHIVAPLSNADHASVIAISRHSGLVWDSVFSAELFGCFKPDPRSYTAATKLLGVKPDEALMVASHKYDLDAAKALGLRTAFIARPLELGPNADVDIAYEERFDFNVNSLTELAEALS